MAITIRNTEIEAMIREIGRHTGEGPSAVVARAVRNLSANRLTPEESRKKFERLMRSVPPRDPNLTWKEVEDDMNSIFD
ncbi:MAG: type II toxin-antitoxin system VapB family antitoxin [Mesorhizobium sp.]|nr:type II toxin-antitoxin system VapB family antitoxin [Mesorhizobium sp.]MCO5162550.1 type II toxin-antitoxin system VapB family antitoxin [Mesorhizobium sp.]